MKNENKKTLGISWRVTLYIALFTVILLAVIWICLVFLLDRFYQAEKTRELMEAGDVIEQRIGTEDFTEFIVDMARERGIDILVINTVSGISTVEKAHSFKSVLNDNYVVGYMINEAEASNGTCIRRAGGDRKRPPDDKNGSMIYCRVVTDENDGKMCILASVELDPVDATVNTVKKQLVIISAIFILLAIVFGLVLSYAISKPIIDINEKAKSLGDGDYGVRFDGDGYREVQELSDTLNTAATELSKVEQLRREFIANVSHDLRTPLTMITGYGEIMRDIPDENTPENVQVIIDEAQHLSRLVNDILSISKIESGMENLDMTEFNITESVGDIISRYSKMKACDGYSITFEYDEPVRVAADETKISQVVYNLIGNAVNYTGDDKTVKIVQSIEHIEGEKYVRFDVYDTGAGISRENIKYVWDRYYKENKAHKRAEVGTGLGLSIVKGVVSLHGGRYGVISREGEGSDFWFSLKAE